jgi:hypothetical protein
MNERKKQRRAIRKAMEYAVADGNLAAAADLLAQYRDDKIALDLLEEFYSYLPEAQEDHIKAIRIVARAQGVFLLAASTEISAYLYLISSEGIEFHGALDQGYLDQSLLDFFGYKNIEKFKALCAAGDDLPLYEPLQIDADVCPACHAITGELHELGCPIEVCPWCGGQLISCPCRFEQLDIEILSSEEELVRLEALLDERGRIAYTPDQRPTFADEGPGVVFE